MKTPITTEHFYNKRRQRCADLRRLYDLPIALGELAALADLEAAVTTELTVKIAEALDVMPAAPF